MPTVWRHGLATRILSAALSLVLMTATVMSAFAHAGHCPIGHHQVSGDVHDASPEQGASDHHHHPAEPNHSHTDCADLICHGGGLAVLNSGGFLINLNWVRIQAYPQNVSAHGGWTFSIDRPPKDPALV